MPSDTPLNDESFYRFCTVVCYKMRDKPEPWDVTSLEGETYTFNRAITIAKMRNGDPAWPRMCFSCGKWTGEHPATCTRPLWNGLEPS